MNGACDQLIAGRMIRSLSGSPSCHCFQLGLGPGPGVMHPAGTEGGMTYISLGRYWMRGKFLGEGSYGAVFVANAKKRSPAACSIYTPKLSNTMAVKSAEFSFDETLRLERRILSQLYGCSSIIHCFGAEVTRMSNGKAVFNLLLEYCSGGTLDERVQHAKGKGLPELEVRQYMQSIVEGLTKIHEEGFVHFDLKPENILLSPINDDEFQAKICDFGLAKGVKEDRQRKRLDRSWHGTPWYLAPEALKEAVQETPTDIWALGIMVLEMLTGRPAWVLEQGSGTEAKKVIRQIQKASCIPRLPAGLSPNAKSFLQSCLRRMAKNRGTAKWLLRHPFICGIRVRPRSPHNASATELTTSCVQLPEFNPDNILKIQTRFE